MGNFPLFPLPSPPAFSSFLPPLAQRYLRNPYTFALLPNSRHTQPVPCCGIFPPALPFSCPVLLPPISLHFYDVASCRICSHRDSFCSLCPMGFALLSPPGMQNLSPSHFPEHLSTYLLAGANPAHSPLVTTSFLWLFDQKWLV